MFPDIILIVFKDMSDSNLYSTTKSCRYFTLHFTPGKWSLREVLKTHD